ncbi:MAG: DUF4249 domain-containing protein [Cyclobacteriaceae bacterium]|nr:DUF4249 domain-containing protein [Cyclobacteriaceae bacterium]
MKKQLYTFFIMSVSVLAAGLLFSSCEDEISPELEKADPILVIDAWLTDIPGSQVITITETQPYFDKALPPGVSGATVSVVDNEGNTFLFQEDAAVKGNYVWTPIASEVIGTIGRTFNLVVEVGGETFVASSRMGRVPTIDSLTFTFEEKNSITPDMYLAEFWARDFTGPNDTYRIKAWKNGVLLNKPSELNLAYDAGFSAGGNFDGVVFATPIRQGVNPFEEDDNNELLSPYMPGDSIYVELHSITLEAFNFLSEVAIQTNRPGGFSELFATPLSNVSTNIFNENPNGKPVLGFFNVASVSALGKKFEE